MSINLENPFRVTDMENTDDLEMALFLSQLPDKDPMGGIENMRRNLERALSCAKDGEVILFEAEIKHWISEIDDFLKTKLS